MWLKEKLQEWLPSSWLKALGLLPEPKPAPRSCCKGKKSCNKKR